MLNPGEEIVFAGSNPTFHRGFSQDYTISVSNRALYLPYSRPFRRVSTKRIDLGSIESVTLSERGSGPILVVATLWLLPLVAIILILEPWAAGGMNRSNLGLRNTVLPLFLTFVAAHETLGRRDRSELVVRAAGRQHRFVTPSDTYSDEKLFDRKVLRKVLDACRSQGVPRCIDRTSESGILP